MTSALRLTRHQLAGGVAIHCVHQGRSDAPPLVLLHGYSDSWFSFSGVIGPLAEHWRVIVPEQRGHGYSDRPASGYAIDDFASDVLDLMNSLHLPAAAIAGHSMGSFVARRVAARAPHRVTQLALIGTAVTARNAVTEDLLEAVGNLTDPVDLGFIREFQTSTVYGSMPPSFLEGVIAESRKLPARVWQAVLQKLLDDPHVDRDLDRIACPTLVLGGARDTIFSAAEQEQAALRIPGAALELQPHTGHSPHWEDPEAFVEAIQRHLMPANAAPMLLTWNFSTTQTPA